MTTSHTDTSAVADVARERRPANGFFFELEFRFGRRRSQHRDQLFYRLLEQSVQTSHAGYRDLVHIGGAKPVTLKPPLGPLGVAPTLAQPVAGRPLRP
ncbi:MAG TPA: hypothetical protein VES02_14035 [Dermatophilaceae bacterium]|nr:hypothetical protein [Dermatophilaceae bacterium]